MRTLILFFFGGLLGLLVPPAAAQKRANSSPAQLRHLVQQSRADTSRVRLLLQLSDFYLDENANQGHALDSALLLSRQAAALSQQLHFVWGSDAALYVTGQVFAKRQATSKVLALMKAASDSTRIKLLLALGQQQLDAASSPVATVDSALYFFRQAEQRSATPALRQWHDESLFQIGTYYVQRDDLPRGKSYFMQAIEADRRAHDKASESRAWYRLGRSFPPFTRNKFLAEKLSYFGQSRTLAHQSRNPKQEVLSLLQIAFIHAYQGKQEQAKRELLEVLAIQKATGDTDTYVAYDTLAELASSKGDFDEALSYKLLCVSGMEAANDRDLDRAYARLGSIYLAIGQPDKTVEALKKSIALSHQKGQRMLSLDLVRVMVNALIRQGKAAEALRFLQGVAREQPAMPPRNRMFMATAWADCYRALHQNKQAENYLLQSVALSKEVDMQDALHITYYIGKFYAATGQYRKARPFLEQLLATPNGMVPADVRQSVHYLSFQVDSAAGNYLAAIAHFRRSKALHDSIYTVAKSQQLTQLQVQYETQKKEQNILLLTEKARHQAARAQRQQSELDRAQTTRNATMGGSLLLLLLLGVSYNRYRLKQRSNQQLEAKQAEINQQNTSLQHLLAEKEWMLKELHHRVKNNLEVISSLLETQLDYLHDPSALTALREGQNRVHAMALIHQKLYQSDSLAVVDMAAYIREIAEHLLESFDCQDTVQLHLRLAPIELEVALATPLGLLINEALTNALKYACPRPRPGNITIELTEIGSQRFRLIIEDDGAGFPPDFDMENGRTMGLTIMRGLSGQIDGTLRITQTPGVRISLDFEAVASAALV